MSYVAQEPLKFHEGSKLDITLPTPREVQVGCRMLFRNFSIYESLKIGDEPSDSIRGSSSMFNVVQELLNPMKVQSWRRTPCS